MELGHFYGTAHEFRTFVDELVLVDRGCLLVALLGIADCLDICFDLTFNDPSHLVRNRITVLDLTINNPRSRIQCLKNRLSAILANSVPCHI